MQLLRTSTLPQFHFNAFIGHVQLCIGLVPKFPAIVIMFVAEPGKDETMHIVALFIDALRDMFMPPLPSYGLNMFLN